MRIACRATQHKQIVLQVAENAIVEDVRYEIAQRLNKPYTCIVLRFAHELLEDDAALVASYNIATGSGITVTFTM